MQQTKTPIEVLASQRAAARRVGGDSLACVRGGRPVFSGLSFAVESGGALALTGANGAGKTSLLRILAGLLAPASGSVVAEGLGEGGLREAAHYLGHRDALKPALSLRENLAFWRAMLGGEGDVVAALDAVGLGHAVDLPAGVLSAGQRRRLSFARLVAIARPVWLLDEPLAALDSAGQEIALNLMRAHGAEGGILIAATHGPLGIPARELRLGGVV